MWARRWRWGCGDPGMSDNASAWVGNAYAAAASAKDAEILRLRAQVAALLKVKEAADVQYEAYGASFGLIDALTAYDKEFPNDK